MSDTLDEPLRLERLRATGLLDTERDPVFDALTRLAARALDVRGALLTLVTPERQWFKSSYGLDEPWHSRRETPLTHSFCRHVVSRDAPLAVSDARADPLVRDNPAIGDMGVIAYLGVPLRDDDAVLGSFAVFDSSPRAWSARDLELLSEFAGLASTQVRHWVDVTRREHIAAQHETLLAQMPSAVLGVATDGRVLYANALAERLWGSVAEEEAASGARVFRVGAASALVRDEAGRAIAPDELPLWRAIALGETTSRREYHVATPEGGERVMRASAVPVVTPAGERLGGLLIADDVTEEVDALRRLREEQERVRSLHASSPVGIFESDVAGSLRSANPRLLRIWHATEAEMLGTGWRRRVHPDDLPGLLAAWRPALAAGSEFSHEYRLRLDDGTVRWVHGRSAPLRDARGRLVGSVGTIEDVTERRAIQEQFVQAQKMEAIGRLAGGIAHDFNNLLTVIRSGAEFLLVDLPPDAPPRHDAEEIRAATERAAQLTRQLLAYGRRQLLRATVVDPNDAVRGVESLLRRVIGEDVRLVTELAHDVGAILVDRGQLDQVLLNLAVNARDAMPGGGTLTIRTERRAGDGAPPAVVIVVADTGVGMDEATRARALEPFFTTKGPDRGTGLGLAVVQGIVTQSGGTIALHSVPGRGTRVELAFPELDELPDEPPAPEAPRAPAGSGTVLLVEDEPQVRTMLCRMLRARGYGVIEAQDAHDAAALWAAHRASGRRIDALVTDVVMPEVDGAELARRLRSEDPALPVLFLSGYAERVLPGITLADGNTRMLEKPVSSAQLAAAVDSLAGRRR